MLIGPSATAGSVPVPPSSPDAGGGPTPQAVPSPNPCGLPDQIVRSEAANRAGRFPGDLYAAVRSLYNAAIGDDLQIAGDPTQPAGSRLLHAGSAVLTVVTLPGGAEALGLKIAAKETLKGGLAQLTYDAIESAGANTGKLILQGGVKLTPDELKVGAEFAGRGKEVIARPPASIGKSADFLVDGKPTELKTISNVRPENAGTAVTKTIKEATKQAKNVVIDARNQKGLTEADAQRAVTNAVRDLPKSAFDKVILMGRDGKHCFELTVTRK